MKSMMGSSKPPPPSSSKSNDDPALEEDIDLENVKYGDVVFLKVSFLDCMAHPRSLHSL